MNHLTIMKKNILLLALLLVSTTCPADSNEPEQDRANIKSMMIKAVDWQLKNPKHNLKDWTNGAFYAGLFAAWETTGSDKIHDALLRMGNTNQWEAGKRFYHADDLAICQTYIDLYRIQRKKEMIQPTINTVNLFIEKPYPIKGDIDIIKWWWCDALFMAPPVLVKLGTTLNDSSYFTANDKYFMECYDLLYNEDERLFARDLRYVPGNEDSDMYEANGKRIFWSRGNGWVMGGLVRILQELPANYSKRPFYEGLYKDMARRVASLQQEDGLWRASLLDPESYPGGEVSGSGFFCYALAWGINNKLLDKETFLPVVRRAWQGLIRCVNEEGRVGWVQPIAGDPQKNFSADSWEVYGTGAFLLAGSEVIKLQKK